MKILKYILFGLLGFIALIYIAALIAPKNFEISKDIVINLPKQEVFDYVKYVKNQDNYGVWQLSDPNLIAKGEGVDGTEGYKYSWESEKLGNGSQTILKIQEGERIETNLDFGFGDPPRSFMTTEEISEIQTKVTWGMSGKYSVPFNLMGLFYDMGKDFEAGLENLKNILENH